MKGKRGWRHAGTKILNGRKGPGPPSLGAIGEQLLLHSGEGKTGNRANFRGLDERGKPVSLLPNP